VSDLVLDASVALAWCFDNEATAGTDRVLERLATGTASVPAIWHVEVANVLTVSERRRRLTPARTTEFIALLETLAIEVDEETPFRAFGRVLDVARTEGLTAYDASYLELAMRLGVPLASKDGDLCDAAERLGLTVLRGA
jgi:predicted nucleic acid-binding protein